MLFPACPLPLCFDVARGGAQEGSTGPHRCLVTGYSRLIEAKTSGFNGNPPGTRVCQHQTTRNPSEATFISLFSLSWVSLVSLVRFLFVVHTVRRRSWLRRPSVRRKSTCAASSARLRSWTPSHTSRCLGSFSESSGGVLWSFSKKTRNCVFFWMVRNREVH